MGSYIEVPPGSSSYWGAKNITFNGSDVTLTASDKICCFLTVLTEQTLNLPSAASRVGIPFFIQVISNDFNNPITIQGDGYNQQVQSTQMGVILMSNGTNWYQQQNQVL